MCSTVYEHASRKKKIAYSKNKMDKEKEKKDRVQICMESDARREEDILKKTTSNETEKDRTTAE